MLDLFEHSNSRSGGRVNNDLNRYFSIQEKSIEKIVKYERSHGKNITSDHFLLKLLYGLPSIEASTPVDFYNAAVEMELELANSLDITCSRNDGSPIVDELYPGKTIVLLDRKGFDFISLLKFDETNWMDITPLVCYKLPKLFNPLTLPKDITWSSKSDSWDYSMVTINIAKFALMAYLWSGSNNKKDAELRESPSQFVSRYVIPNILPSQSHAALVSDVYNTLEGNGFIREKPESSQWVLDYTSDLTAALAMLIGDLPLTSNEVEETLEVIPSLYGKSFLDHIPDIGDNHTQLNLWALFPLVLNNLRLSEYLVRKSDGGMSDLRHRFKYEYRQYKSNSVLRRINDPKLKTIIQKELDAMATKVI